MGKSVLDYITPLLHYPLPLVSHQHSSVQYLFWVLIFLSLFLLLLSIVKSVHPIWFFTIGQYDFSNFKPILFHHNSFQSGSGCHNYCTRTVQVCNTGWDLESQGAHTRQSRPVNTKNKSRETEWKTEWEPKSVSHYNLIQAPNRSLIWSL